MCDVSTGARRPLVPLQWRKKVFDMVHTLSHAGPRPTAKAIAQRFVWQNYKKDVNFWCQQCVDCQKSKVHTHVKAPLQRRETPSRRFGSIHIDLVGPLPESKGYKYLLTIRDRFTRWVEAIPLKDISAESCVQGFLHGWVERFGVPDDVVADLGAQFTSSYRWR